METTDQRDDQQLLPVTVSGCMTTIAMLFGVGDSERAVPDGCCSSSALGPGEWLLSPQQ